jgi:hypothetical protein
VVEQRAIKIGKDEDVQGDGFLFGSNLPLHHHLFDLGTARPERPVHWP